MSNGYKILDDSKIKKYASTYLNFQNIVIIPHHGKSTVHLLVNLCKHFNIDKLESAIGYYRFDKDSLNIWKLLNKIENLNEALIPIIVLDVDFIQYLKLNNFLTMYLLLF